MIRLILRLRLAYARHQLARARARMDELAARRDSWVTQDRGSALRAAVLDFDLSIATRDASAWHFEVGVLEQELAEPGPVRRTLARGARWCERFERGSARLWEGRAEAAPNATSSADARERAYECHSEADGWAATAERLEGRAPSARVEG